MRKLTNRQKLLKKIDDARREYIRKRDLDWRDRANCISCFRNFEKGELQAGQFKKRQHDFTTELATEYRNVNLQCERCNGFLRGNESGYALGIVRKYGDNVLEEIYAKFIKDRNYKIGELEKILEELNVLILNPSNR